MSSSIIAMMIGVSIFLGTIALLSLIWGVRTGQFDDKSKFINATKFDSQDALNDAVMLEKRKEKAIKKKKEKEYRPLD